MKMKEDENRELQFVQISSLRHSEFLFVSKHLSAKHGIYCSSLIFEYLYGAWIKNEAREQRFKESAIMLNKSSKYRRDTHKKDTIKFKNWSKVHVVDFPRDDRWKE